MNDDRDPNTSVFVEREKRSSNGLTGRLVLGLVLVSLGVLWTLDNLNVYDASQALRWWGAVPLLWGVLQMLGVGAPRRRWGGAVWAIIGAVSLLHAADWFPLSVGQLWPLILIFIGARIVSRHLSGSPITTGASRTDSADASLNTFVLWAGSDVKVVSRTFRGGEINAVMAGATVDLRPAQLEGGRAVLEVFTIWGGIEIVVPRGWRVQGDVTPIMAGFEDSTVHPTDPNAPVLVVHGFAVMGGIEVKNTSERDTVAPIVRDETASFSPSPVE